ncbi:MAG TPA: flavin reductase [Ramlibacter sp.]|nr:flavin reductase [Ramlibacter sp.]
MSVTQINALPAQQCRVPALDAKALRSALSCFATGVCVVTTRTTDGVDVGLTANSFTSVSLSPPLVLWSLSKSSSAIDAFNESSHFAVHVLAADQEDLSSRFATKGIDRFEGVPLERNAQGVPLLTRSAARFECQMAHKYDGGDHLIFVGEVLRFDAGAAQPLVFHAGRYAEVAHIPGPVAREETDGCLAPTDLSYLIWRAFMQFRRRHYDQRRRIGWTEADAYVLQILAMQEGQTVAELAEHIAITGELCTPEAVRALMERGLLEPDLPVGPETHLRLAAPAKAMVRELTALARAAEGQLLSKMTAAEGRRLKHVLNLIIENTPVGDTLAQDARP